MYNFVVHSNDISCRKRWRPGMDPAITKLIPYSPIYSVYIIYFTAIIDVDKKNLTKPSKRGFKCIKCHELANCSITWKKNITNNLK